MQVMSGEVKRVQSPAGASGISRATRVPPVKRVSQVG